MTVLGLVLLLLFALFLNSVAPNILEKHGWCADTQENLTAGVLGTTSLFS